MKNNSQTIADLVVREGFILMIKDELDRAYVKHGAESWSRHEFYSILLEEVVEDPKLNTKKYLAERTGELGKLKKQELEKLAEKAKVRIEQVENKEDSMIKQKYWVS
ncbi:hypothetical protein LCGC14_2313110 [marine sediment metagenome]|uniref:Uncharacterized protein n=1 Tax=marine sediment metagenome TaxID=412755 RepID=A0A0F9EXG3_9ZZZZ